jgi:glycosyltransferase 2 family protein
MPRIALFAKLAASLGLLGYLWFKIDPLVAFERLRHTNVAILVTGTLVLAIQPLIGALRWQLILACLEQPLALGVILKWTYVSVFFGQVLPATVGADGMRVWLARGSGFGPAFNSVVLDRVVMLLTLAALMALGAPSLGRLTGTRQFELLPAILLAGGGIGAIILMIGGRLPADWQHLWFAHGISQLARDCRQLFLSPKFACGALVLCLASYGSLIIGIYLFAVAFGANADLARFLVLIPPVLAAGTLPISIGGWGTREVAMVAALGLVAINADVAVLTSVWLGVASIIVALPGAVVHFIDGVPLKAPSESPVLGAHL